MVRYWIKKICAPSAIHGLFLTALCELITDKHFEVYEDSFLKVVFTSLSLQITLCEVAFN